MACISCPVSVLAFLFSRREEEHLQHDLATRAEHLQIILVLLGLPGVASRPLRYSNTVEFGAGIQWHRSLRSESQSAITILLRWGHLCKGLNELLAARIFSLCVLISTEAGLPGRKKAGLSDNIRKGGRFSCQLHTDPAKMHNARYVAQWPRAEHEKFAEANDRHTSHTHRPLLDGRKCHACHSSRIQRISWYSIAWCASKKLTGARFVYIVWCHAFFRKKIHLIVSPSRFTIMCNNQLQTFVQLLSRFRQLSEILAI